MSVATLLAPDLRVLPAPASCPPYDDAAREGSRAFPLRLAPRVLSLVPPLEEPGPWTRPRSTLDALPEARTAVRALVQRLMEVQDGVRPLSQLQRDTSPELYARLERWSARRPAPAPGAPHPRRQVRSTHAQTRADGVAECCATVVTRTPQGPRVHALALRLEGQGGRWCCVELEGL